MKVDSVSTQPAPASSSAAIVTGSNVLRPAIAAARPKPALAQRTIASVDSTWRSRVDPIAPATAPTPNEPSSSPYVSGPPAISVFAISGINAITPLAPMQKSALRSSTMRIAGDIDT